MLGKEIRYAGHDMDAFEEQMRKSAPSRSAFDIRMMFQGYLERGFVAEMGDVEKLTKLLGHEALKAYGAGWKVFSSAGHAAALPLFKRAVEIDLNFAMAHASLGRMYSGTEEPALSRDSTTRACQLRDHTSDREKFYISTSYELRVTGNLEKARQTCEAWTQAYPRDTNSYGFLGGMIYVPTAKYEKAIEEMKVSIDFDPDIAILYALLALHYQYLDQFGEAESTLQQAAGRKLEIPDLIVQLYDLAFLKGDLLPWRSRGIPSNHKQCIRAPVAQLDRASGYEEKAQIPLSRFFGVV